jgi:hypothetical protein
MSSTISRTPEELKRWREDLLSRVHMSYEELRRRAMSYTLSPEERDAYETIRSIDYLLGE